MKKVFAILLVLAVVTGFVFAAESAPTQGDAETHVIVVKSTVALVVPGFSFSYSEAKTNNVEATTDGSTAAAFANNGNYKVPTAQDIGQNIADKDVEATFTIKSNRVCNYNGSFSLSVAASAFKSETLTTNATQKSVTYAANTDNHSADHITIANYVAEGTATTANPLKVTYAGKQSSASVILGTVTVVWNQDTAAVPDTYTSDVTLTVTAL